MLNVLVDIEKASVEITYDVIIKKDARDDCRAGQRALCTPCANVQHRACMPRAEEGEEKREKGE